jgi:cell division protein FtsN
MNNLISISIILAAIIGFTSCKPKESAYKSVYEAAKERELAENKNTETVSKPAYPTYNPNSDAPVKVEKINPVNASDASHLKTYSVVVASLSVKPNADILKSKIEKDGYKVILAQNESGLYRVIVASYNDKSQAAAERDQIKKDYFSKGDSEYLMKTYNIPFDDLWILERQY